MGFCRKTTNFPFLHNTKPSQSNPINNITNGPCKSGHINNIASKVFLNKENDWVFSPESNHNIMVSLLSGHKVVMTNLNTTETGRLFFRDAWNSCCWRESRMFWATWQNACEHILSCCVTQFFLHASSESSQSSIFGFRC